MKPVITVLLTAAAAFAFSANAATYKFVAANNLPGTKLCISAVKNDLIGYKDMAKRYHVRHKYIANNVTCNGEEIASFAAAYGATRTAEYINRFHKGKVSIIDIAKAAKDKQQAAGDEQEVILVMVH
ncbi:DUF3718 domain-containing protein [Thalassomonas haliotis]|uniref:DUF3718 domain-containing protein n=1 Tax=Thalassomonas haliotis TaxID=485448 RepID=A0ABY7VJ19_9GAMM|nr:DUF3718 domain-containing protein [Thalassomonas haliotis]WDE13473.1 DUF3718 domain-containing protein [Thalassomonas haliotis]